MRLVVSGLIAAYPLGGVAWDYAQYVAGFQRLGHEVLYLEDTGNWLYDPVLFTYTDDARHNADYLGQVMKRFGIEHWCLRDPKDQHWGMTEAAVADWCTGTDVLLNVSGSLWLRANYEKARCKVYLDSDPGYTQAKIQRVLQGRLEPNEKDYLEGMRLHDHHFTFGENIGQPDCTIPTDLFKWKPTRQPILLDEWIPRQPDGSSTALPPIQNPKSKIQNPSSVWTTVMSWKIDERPPEIAGRKLGGKNAEFEQFIDLPATSGVPMEIALSGGAPREQLTARGWQLIDGYTASRDTEIYRDYIWNSRAEWSVAKQVYVAPRSGWFSCRTACYLAAGKPAVVQDTAWSKYYPTGRGLFAFNTLAEATEAIRQIEAEYNLHCAAARELAADYFDSNKVLGKFLNDLT